MYLGISSIFITFILFLNKELDGLKPNKDFLEFYTRKNTHPHTLVRLHYILVHYIFNAKNNSALIDKQDTLNNIFKICSRYFNDSNIFNDFIQAFNSNIREINSYDTELYLESLKMKNLIRHKINLFKLE